NVVNGVQLKDQLITMVKAESAVSGVTEKAVTKGTGKGTGLKSRKLSSKQIELDWLADKYTAVEVKGTVKVSGKEVDVSRRVYQIEIDKNYVPNNPKALGKSNRELMKKGNSPYIVKAGVESKVELHHLIQKEPGGMIEIAELTHDKYDFTLHGLVGNGNSFRNDPELEKIYNNFRGNYWKMRARD
ncbi:HNH/ENDO VII family nuclease, partial [Bhargavaea beijingensis]|uniref:HNH/ENDO VII family nuclease n=1 Tax=Bhargavaea beijingensis TaxID=426756 RepID=UPI0029CABC73